MNVMTAVIVAPAGKYLNGMLNALLDTNRINWNWVRGLRTSYVNI